MKLKITPLKKSEIKEIAKIASENFSGLKDFKKAVKWITCNFRAFPRMQYFSAKSKNKILGYILWVEKGGFREKAVWELEQLAIKKELQKKGIGTELIKKSLLGIRKYLKKRNSTLKLIKITTGKGNKARKIYQKALGAKVECNIKDFFRTDEVIMIARFK